MSLPSLVQDFRRVEEARQVFSGDFPASIPPEDMDILANRAMCEMVQCPLFQLVFMCILSNVHETTDKLGSLSPCDHGHGLYLNDKNRL